MNSKEALSNIEKLFIGSSINLAQQIEIIKKDLEVLEIIKKYLVRTFDYPEGGDYFCLELHKFTNEKEGMKFKEWYENE
ncbi:MAG: hypothetical protein PUK09_05870 [Bacilli bacterium]|nr:hypothetical protein [Bacilli bacterium]